MLRATAMTGEGSNKKGEREVLGAHFCDEGAQRGGQRQDLVDGGNGVPVILRRRRGAHDVEHAAAMLRVGKMSPESLGRWHRL